MVLVPLLERRQTMPDYQRLSIYVGSLLLAGIASLLLLSYAGVPPRDLFAEIVATAFSSPRSLGSVLVQAAPLIIAGLATALAFRANFWNIGLEGQMITGAVLATFVALHDIGPEATRLPLMALAAALGGIVWIAAPAFLKQRLGVSEIITTLLLNYVAFNLLLHLLYGPWQDPVSNFPHSARFEAAERLPSLGWLNLTWTLPFALILAGLLWWTLSFSRAGYLMDMASANRDMAHAVGVPVAALSLGAILGSGAIGGLTGFAITAGVEFRMTQDFFVGYLFSGVLIAFLGRNHPLGVIAVATFLAVLFLVGQSLQVFFGVPSSLVQLIQAIFIIFVAASEFFLTYRMRWTRAA